MRLMRVFVSVGMQIEPCRLRADAHVYAGEPSHPHARADVNALARDDCVGDYGRAGRENDRAPLHHRWAR